jgi:hypothetical protein
MADVNDYNNQYQIHGLYDAGAGGEGLESEKIIGSWIWAVR